MGLALSGGGDSRALACLIDDWLCQSGRADETRHAFIVDHALREGSGREARDTADWIRARGWTPHILTWTESSGGPGLQERARKARHILLARACSSVGVRRLALAHTRDDQVETQIMRLTAGGSWRSLAGMDTLDVSPAWPEGRDLLLTRPVLDQDRQALRAYLRARGESWIDDPSNADTAFTRIRIRDSLARHQAAPRWRQGFDRLGCDIGVLKRFERNRIARFLMRVMTLHAWGGAQLDRQAWRDVPHVVKTQTLSLLVEGLAGRSDPVRQPVLNRLVDAVEAGETLTGGGVQVFCDDGKTVWLFRDPGMVLGRVDHPGGLSVALDVQSPQVVDGRYEISTPKAGLIVAPLRDDRDLPPNVDLAQIPARARSGLLAVRQGETCLAVLGLPGEGTDQLQISPLIGQRLAWRLFPGQGKAWFYGK